MAVGIQMASIAEAMSFGGALGLDLKTLASIFNASSSRCWSSVDYNPVPVSLLDLFLKMLRKKLSAVFPEEEKKRDLEYSLHTKHILLMENC